MGLSKKCKLLAESIIQSFSLTIFS